MDFKRINSNECRALMATATVTLIDIRDKHAFEGGHIEGARHIDDLDMPTFLNEHDKNVPLIICCYHGHSSLSAAGFFAAKGFGNVYSLDGGYTAWQAPQ